MSTFAGLHAAEAHAQGTVQVALFPTAAGDASVQPLADALGTAVIGALNRYPELAIAARPALDLPTMQLALGCDDSSDDCLRAAIALAHTQALLAPAVQRTESGETVVTLLYFDVIEGVSRTVERRHSAAQTQADIVDSVPGMLAEALQRTPAASAAVPGDDGPAAGGEPQDVPGEVSVELPPEPTATRSSSLVLPITLGVAGAALIAGGAVFGILANQSESQLGDLPVRTREEANAAADKLDEGETQATLANIGFGVGAAALAAGITLWVLDGESPAESQAGTASLTPSLGSQGGGLVLHGRW
jgi:hypothetical protein